MLECVINISEGRNSETLAYLDKLCDSSLLDRHSDPFHNRSVYTLCGPNVLASAKALARGAVERLSLIGHHGEHPRYGVIDVVPFIPLEKGDLATALEARDGFASFAKDLGLGVLLYGESTGQPSLPQVRARLRGSPQPQPGSVLSSLGTVIVGVRKPLIAYNLIVDSTPSQARRTASLLRGPNVRALVFDIGGEVQISTNLINPATYTPYDLYQAVREHHEVISGELVGLLPRQTLKQIPRTAWDILGVAETQTIEYRYAQRFGHTIRLDCSVSDLG